MSRRLSIVLLVTGATLAFALPGGARTAQNTLSGTVGPGFTIRLTDESGALVSHLDPGTYTINVKDQADIHNFDLHGPGVSQQTDIEFVGTVTWTVTFTDGIYAYNCVPWVEAMLASRCADRNAGRSIDFFPSGMSCGGTIALARPGMGIEIRVNWLTGGVDIVPQKLL